MITRCPTGTRLLYAVQFAPKKPEIEKIQAFDKYRDHLHSCEECKTAINEIRKWASMPREETDSMLDQNRLKQIVSKLTKAAKKHEGVPQKFILANGLVIEVLQENGSTNLILNRAGYPPSDHDWTIVTACLPVPAGAPIRDTRQGRPCLIGQLGSAA